MQNSLMTNREKKIVLCRLMKDTAQGVMMCVDVTMSAQRFE